MSIVPYDIDFADWADQMSVEILRFGPPPAVANEDAWRDWADEVVAIPAIGRLQPPNPSDFVDWRDWAVLLYELFDRG